MTPKSLVLVVDDEEDMRELVAMNLRRAGYAVVEAADGVTGLAVARQRMPACVVLDVMMPGRSGLQVLQELRGDEALKHIPVVMLTAKAMTEDRVAGLEKGADDYLAKPFSPKELVLRVQAVLRRAESGAAATTGLTVGPFHFDRVSVQLRVNGGPVDLTLLEFKLLHLLASCNGEVVEREVIMREVWGYSDSVRTRTLDTHMKRVREKLGDAAGWIHTVRGYGYAFRRPEQAAGQD
jgi:two-component system phosphate regulon response regulator PhoB